MKKWLFPFLLVLVAPLPALAAERVLAASDALGPSDVPADEERLLKERIDELFPSTSEATFPEPDATDEFLAAASNLGYVPLKLSTAAIYTLAGFFHCAAMVPREGLRIFAEGWSGDWLVRGPHVTGAEPLDLVGPDREFPGHNPVARDAFVRSWYLLYSSLPYRGLPKGVDLPAGGGARGPQKPPL